MALNRNYSYKDVDMLIGAKTVAENFTTHQARIIEERPLWADPFITNFTERIDNAMIKYLGLDPKADLKSATRVVLEIQANALKDLSLFKVQVETDLAKDKAYMKRVLDNLGFDKTFTLARKRDQQALTQVLFKFKKGMKPALETELTTKGINGALIDRIQGYADTLTQANVTQESLKGTTKNITAEATTEFNEIYTEVIGICKVCTRIFVADQLIKPLFSFRQIITSMNKLKAAPKADDDSAEAA